MTQQRAEQQASLVPGYKQVEAFSPELEDEYEEETTYVTLDLGLVGPSLVANSTSYRLIGLDTPTPYLQLSDQIFKGEYYTLLGSEILFADGRDEADRTRKFVVPHALTSETRVAFSEVKLVRKAAAENGENSVIAGRGMAEDGNAQPREVEAQGNGGSASPLAQTPVATGERLRSPQAEVEGEDVIMADRDRE
ncbi:hypothetical protein BOTBODRAFT_32759 [Botryobasidium botryosum FD-172 SS1]|uniref:Transcription factor TFIIIC triple barrel domain-containing protein n=1 Tax=Botryobasidium botryosum (strain FD-172 SS1) TaxID=930990 RepID=A0A067MFF6_BOTB1|nr:hypothetical protein BOTBODRAFT_32759 [Botryobasidium botryosum FD-172 SS1]